MQRNGFTLIEVLVALAVLCVAALGGIQLVAAATRMTSRAGVLSTSAALAASRMEQLRALQFEFDINRLRLTDVTTDLASDPPVGGGPGLTPSGGGSLDANTPGYVDFADAHGTPLGGGGAPPQGAVFVRRWSVEPVGASSDLLLLQVLVRPLAEGAPGPGGRGAREVRLVTMLARTLP
jgi:prepilin-type N-terminal cleavage/methylation domain-containing protein